MTKTNVQTSVTEATKVEILSIPSEFYLGKHTQKQDRHWTENQKELYSTHRLNKSQSHCHPQDVRILSDHSQDIPALKTL